ncbi:MAG: RelA/SpoT domain-containing protein [Candidatus Limnocylindria bacterium]
MTTPHERIGLSRAQVDRSGALLREWTLNGLLAGSAEEDASRALNAYRSEFKKPLRSVVMGLRSAVRTEGAEVVVAERLKRQPRIVGKLIRFPRMELTRMQDIAGCRAILPDLRTVDAVRRRIEQQKSQIVKVNDYNGAPKSSGYRAVHVVVNRNGALVEIQLRTVAQQGWAMLVEDLDAAYRLQLKDETGPEEVLEFLRVYASALTERERTGSLSGLTAQRLGAARMTAQRRLITGGTR